MDILLSHSINTQHTECTSSLTHNNTETSDKSMVTLLWLSHLIYSPSQQFYRSSLTNTQPVTKQVHSKPQKHLFQQSSCFTAWSSSHNPTTKKQQLLSEINWENCSLSQTNFKMNLIWTYTLLSDTCYESKYMKHNKVAFLACYQSLKTFFVIEKAFFLSNNNAASEKGVLFSH